MWVVLWLALALLALVASCAGTHEEEGGFMVIGGAVACLMCAFWAGSLYSSNTLGENLVAACAEQTQVQKERKIECTVRLQVQDGVFQKILPIKKEPSP